MSLPRVGLNFVLTRWLAFFFNVSLLPNMPSSHQCGARNTLNCPGMRLLWQIGMFSDSRIHDYRFHSPGKGRPRSCQNLRRHILHRRSKTILPRCRCTLFFAFCQSVSSNRECFENTRTAFCSSSCPLPHLLVLVSILFFQPSPICKDVSSELCSNLHLQDKREPAPHHRHCPHEALCHHHLTVLVSNIYHSIPVDCPM